MTQDSERFFSLSLDMLCIAGVDGFFKRVNPAFETVLGWTAQQLLSRPFVEWIHPEDVSATLAEIEKLASGLPTVSFENRYRCADGEYKVLNWTAYPEPETGIIFAVARDVTEIRQADERFRVALEASPAGMLVVDTAGVIVLANRAAEDLLGYDAGELAEKVVATLLPAHLRAVHKGYRLSYLGEPVARPMGQGRDLHAMRKDGTPVQVEIGLNPVRLNGQLALLIAMVDITARKAAEAYLAQSRDNLLAVLNGLREGVFIIDRSGKIVFVNQTAARLFGPQSENCKGQPWQDVIRLEATGELTFERLLESPADRVGRSNFSVSDPAGRRHVLELEVQDDPRENEHRLVFLYDITEVLDLRHLLDERVTFHDIVAKSGAMQLVFEQIRQVAPLDWTVLVQGETGTGKELAARAIHYQGPRKSGPFIPVNCAALSESLLTSQLFGHCRGAFTGAVSDQKGVFESASGGTIFLDEIGDMPLSTQANLLRVLQEREITRLGESQPRKVDVRVIAATHCDLKRKVDEGSFRSDLYYRIHGFRISLPPLRERHEDIPLLAHYVLRVVATQAKKAVPDISQQALRRLMDYSWPGNVRELRSAIEWAAMRCAGVVQIEDLPPEVVASASPGDVVAPPDDEKSRILRAIQEAGGNRSEVARRLGISRATLYRRLAELGLTGGTS
jgi:PAS domain S-box-containing protein